MPHSLVLFLQAALVFVAAAIGALAQVGPGAECVCFQEFGDGQLANPLSINHMFDGSGRLLVAEQRGLIWIFNPDGSRNPTPYLNMTEFPLLLNMGLMNFAHHAEYATNGRIYVFYVAFDVRNYMRISEMIRSDIDPDVIDLDTERVVWDVEYPFDTAEPKLQHQGGALLFGTDGYLYAGFGDGHCCYDPLGHGQNKSSPQAAMIRIDVDSRTGDLEYGIPPDNPFLNDTDAIPELYAYGIRQPYSADVDFGDPTTGEGRGRIFVGDVGEVDYEEVIELLPGDNYGWPNWEGSLCLQPDECLDMGPVTHPIIQYNRTIGICVILAGIYRGCESPDLNGWMIFVDYANPAIFGATENPDGTWSLKTIPTCASCPPGLTNSRKSLAIGPGVDENGEFWFGAGTSSAPFQPDASVYKIVDPNKYVKNLWNYKRITRSMPKTIALIRANGSYTL